MKHLSSFDINLLSQFYYTFCSMENKQNLGQWDGLVDIWIVDMNKLCECHKFVEENKLVSPRNNISLYGPSGILLIVNQSTRFMYNFLQTHIGFRTNKVYITSLKAFPFTIIITKRLKVTAINYYINFVIVN